MPKPKLTDLTLKQRTFAHEYVRENGNGTKAAKKAGYAPASAHVQASRAIRNDKVVEVINYLTRRHEISADRVLTRLDNLSIKAEQEGQIGAAIKAEELLGKSLGMWVERSVNVNVDLNGEHLKALQDRMNRRRDQQLNARGNADTKTIDITPTHQEHTFTKAVSDDARETLDRQRESRDQSVTRVAEPVAEMGDGEADARATHAASAQEGGQ